MSKKSDTKSVSNQSDEDSLDLRKALRTIALELDRFPSCSDEILCESCPAEPNLIEDICKSSLKFKDNQVQQLRTRLKIACGIANISVVFPENKSHNCNNQQQKSQLESATSSRDKVHFLGYLDKLTREYTTTSMKLEVLRTIIELGYGKLQNLCNKTLDPNLDIASKLNQLIFACGQFYANYYNKVDKCKKLEMQNAQLTNKIKKKSEELTLLRQALHQARKAKEAIEEQQIKKNKTPQGVKHKAITENKDKISEKDIESLFTKPAVRNFNHIDIIRSLIEEQENMVSSLKAFTNELNETCSNY